MKRIHIYFIYNKKNVFPEYLKVFTNSSNILLPFAHILRLCMATNNVVVRSSWGTNELMNLNVFIFLMPAKETKGVIKKPKLTAFFVAKQTCNEKLNESAEC